MSDTAKVGTTRAFESMHLLPSEAQIVSFCCDIAYSDSPAASRASRGS
jgi:hypothetical protein